MEMRHFFSQLETTLGSGITLGRALHLIGKELKSWSFQKKVKAMEKVVQDGSTLSEAMKQSGSPFTKMHISFIQFGEETGCLDRVCGALAKNAEKDLVFSRQIAQAMAYPGFVLICALIAGPIISDAIKNGEVTSAVIAPIGINLGIFAGALFCLWIAKGFLSGGVFDSFLAHLPFIGGIMQQMALSRFSRALSVSQFAGVPLMQGITTAIDVSGNPWLQSKLKDLPALVGSGKGIATAMEHSGVVPGTLKEMIMIGEQSGKLPEMLEKTADYYEEEATNKINFFMKIVPVLCFLPIAIYVGFLIIGSYQKIRTVGF